MNAIEDMGLVPDSEEYRIYFLAEDAINIERYLNGIPLPFDLSYYYKIFKEAYFGSSIPELSSDFVCVFQKLPYDVTGITLLERDATENNVTKGIRINEKLKEFPGEARVALLHEMIHATGLRGHKEDFKLAVQGLWNQRAYLDPLIV